MEAGKRITKRIPLIKFPDRSVVRAAPGPAPAPTPAAASSPSSAAQSSAKSPGTSATSTASAGAASIQPRRPKVSKEEIDAVLLGGAV